METFWKVLDVVFGFALLLWQGISGLLATPGLLGVIGFLILLSVLNSIASSIGALHRDFRKAHRLDAIELAEDDDELIRHGLDPSWASEEEEPAQTPKKSLLRRPRDLS